ncbi:MAG: ATP-binding cassette domain-containing protein [Planctomycetota bacterium]
MTERTAAIRLERVRREFAREGAESVVAVRDLDLEVARGEAVALVGPSGCGKTTTLRLVNRLEEPTSGRVLVDGVETATVDPVALRRGMGYVIQSGGLFPHLTVARNIGLVAELEGWDEARRSERVRELLELVHLSPEEHGGRWPSELSGGQRQRVGVARALMLDPPILLLDEPFGALDPVTRGSLHSEFADLVSKLGKTLVVVTHDLGEAFLLGDRVALMMAGEVVQVGTREEFEAESADPRARDFMEEHLRAT